MQRRLPYLKDMRGIHTVPAKEHRLCPFPYAPAAIVSVFRTSFSKDFPQISQCLLALSDDRLCALARVLRDLSFLEVVMRTF